jgi:AraC-like DNA-binding protein
MASPVEKAAQCHRVANLSSPPRNLASCVAGCIVRDTRGTHMPDENRLNYFPASPLFSATMTLEGQLHIADGILPMDAVRALPAAPKILYQKPQDHPQMSWSPGPFFALTVAFFPDAWLHLGGTLDARPSEKLEHALSHLQIGPLDTAWPKVWRDIAQLRASRAGPQRTGDWTGSDKIKDWSYHLLGQLAQTSAGRSLRSAQRRLKQWTGLNMQTLEFFAKVEDVHRRIAQAPATSAADLAADAGFADQSHMGRALKRATGFSTIDLNRKIATEEAFWCYRLLGKRF